MKKQLFLVLSLTATLLTVSCSNNNYDDNTPTNQQPATTHYFHAPTWI